MDELEKQFLRGLGYGVWLENETEQDEQEEERDE